jgi:hypothetical protein
MAVAIVFFIIFAIGASIWGLSRGRSLLEEWAESHKLNIISAERRSLWRGPFSFTSKGREVYYVTFEDQEGVRRNAYVRLGGAFRGMLSDHVDVRWE